MLTIRNSETTLYVVFVFAYLACCTAVFVLDGVGSVALRVVRYHSDHPKYKDHLCISF